MFNIFSNISRILFRRKSFIITTFVLPVVIVLVFSSMFNSVSTYSIAVINNDEGKIGKEITEELKDIEGINIKEVDENENYEEGVAFHYYEMALVIDKDFSKKVKNQEKCPINMITIGESDYKSIVKNLIQSKSSAFSTLSANLEVNDSIINEYKDARPTLETNSSEKKPSILNSFGMIIYMIVISAGLSCSFALEDEREGTKDRILMSNITEKGYFGAQCILYFLLAMIPAIEYYVICNVMDYEFGFENTALLLVILVAAVILTVVCNLFLSAVVKNKSAFNLITSTCSIPLFMLSGTFWSFDFMSDGLQAVGNCLPPRWLMQSIESLQNGQGAFDSIMPMMIKTLSLAIVLFILCIVCTKHKIVLIKDHKTNG